MVTAATLRPEWVHELPTGKRPRLVHVNTHSGFGGVAELLRALVRAQRTRGLAVGWAVISGTEEFYLQAKRLHRLMHGHDDPTELRAPRQRALYRSILRPQSEWLATQLGPEDIVVLHDPQTLGMAAELAATGARVVWHLHVGTDDAAKLAEIWPFFADDLGHLSDVLATRTAYLPPGWLCPAQRHVLGLAIDPQADKNRPLAGQEVRTLLAHLGLTGATPAPTDGWLDQDAPLPADAPVVLQVSRWDPLKDMLGVQRCFAGLDGHDDAHLVLAGPDPFEVADDPEGLAVLAEVRSARAALPPDRRARIHLAMLSMRRPDRNALLVNALQRRADVVVQKSLEEGFGLTATEAMFKGKALLAGDTGGLRLQVTHGRTGLLVEPTDDHAVRASLSRLLADRELRTELGRRAHDEVVARFLMSGLADRYLALVSDRLTVS